MPFVSVIVPFFDDVPYLRLAVDSVRMQAVAGTEIIIVNDNPARFDAAAIRAICGDDGVTILEHAENRGPAAARNTGLDVAQGDYVVYLDADDYYLDGGLREHLQFAQETGADITHAPYDVLQMRQNKVENKTREGMLFGERGLRGRLVDFPEAQFMPFTSSLLFRRDFIERANCRFDPTQRGVEDRLCVLQAVTSAGSIATLGKPVRVYRRRIGSLTSTPEDDGKRLLALGLMEKCLALMAAEVESGRLPPVFFRRELFHTIARLMHGRSHVREIAAAPESSHAKELSARIRAMLGDKTFGPKIFNDPVLTRLSYRKVKGEPAMIEPGLFQKFHSALREGDFAAAAAVTARTPRKLPAPAVHVPVSARLVLHIGAHKTGTTFVQGNLRQTRSDLVKRGILFPETGDMAEDFDPVRPGGSPGHQGLLNAVMAGDDAVRAALFDEIARSGAEVVVISCENILRPLVETAPKRVGMIDNFFSGFTRRDLVVGLRRPDIWADRLYRELVCNGLGGTRGSAEAFYHEFSGIMFDLPSQLAPFEDQFGTRTKLINFDAAVSAGRLWGAHLDAFGLPPDLPEASGSWRNPIPSRSDVAAAELVHYLVPEPDARRALLHAFFRLPGVDGARSDAPLLPPEARVAQIEMARRMSEHFAAERGHTPDWDGWIAAVRAEPWQPPGPLPLSVLRRLADAAQVGGLTVQAQGGVLPVD
ncbi:MAG: glycosyltransferase family 2 protein [Gemmobacter sp.]|nr:glycosyltransferase family 2 protein [Gemmobacter sp.]